MNILFIALLLFVTSCTRPAFMTGMGTGGKYLEARDEVTRRGGNIDKATQNLEIVVRDDPTCCRPYNDSLTLLGRAYYLRNRYGDAKLILQRAVVVNQEDEIGWMVLGITRLQLGEDETGLKEVQGGLTLFSKVSRSGDYNYPGYRGYRFWDRAGNVRVALRRAVIVAQKELDERDGRENIIRAVERLIAVADEEEWALRRDKTTDTRREFEGR